MPLPLPLMLPLMMPCCFSLRHAAFRHCFSPLPADVISLLILLLLFAISPLSLLFRCCRCHAAYAAITLSPAADAFAMLPSSLMFSAAAIR